MGGRTPPIETSCRRTRRRINDYRRTLRRQHQPTFKQLFDGTRQFADAADYATNLDCDRLILVSTCYAQQLRVAELEERVDDLEVQLGRE